MSERYVPDVTVPASVQKDLPFLLALDRKKHEAREDLTILTGKGIYVDDIALPNMAHAAVLRSPYAHARIKSIDTTPRKSITRGNSGGHRCGVRRNSGSDTCLILPSH